MVTKIKSTKKRRKIGMGWNKQTNKKTSGWQKKKSLRPWHRKRDISVRWVHKALINKFIKFFLYIEKREDLEEQKNTGFYTIVFQIQYIALFCWNCCLVLGHTLHLAVAVAEKNWLWVKVPQRSLISVIVLLHGMYQISFLR